MHTSRNQLAAPDLAPPSLLQPNLIPRLLEALRFRRYSLKTEKNYIHWVVGYIHFHAKRHPKDLGAAEVTAFLNRFANRGTQPGRYAGELDWIECRLTGTSATARSWPIAACQSPSSRAL